MKLVKRSNDLATLYPNLVKEWDYENNDGKTPDQFAEGSNERINWICKECGYKWSAKIVDRAHGQGCPACAGKAINLPKSMLTTPESDLAEKSDC